MLIDTALTILQNKPITSEKLFEFIIEYVKLKKERDITPNELKTIVHMIQIGAFNIQFAAEQVAKDLSYYITKIYDKNGVLLNVIITK